MKIRHRYTDAVLYSGDHATMREAVESAMSSGASLTEANLEGAYLADAHLEGANLADANLARASLEEANLAGASLEGASLDRASLEGANLEGANLEGANLEGAYLDRACLDGTYLAEASLIDAGQDVRGYRFVGVRHNAGPMIAAGCRWFTLEQARTHWSEEGKSAECLAKVEMIAAEANRRGWPMSAALERAEQAERKSDQWEMASRIYQTRAEGLEDALGKMERERDEARRLFNAEYESTGPLKRRLARLEEAARADIDDARAACGGNGEGCKAFRAYYESAERRHRKCGQCPMDATATIRAALDAEPEEKSVNGLGERAPIRSSDEAPGLCVEREDSVPASEPASPEPADDEARALLGALCAILSPEDAAHPQPAVALAAMEHIHNFATTVRREERGRAVRIASNYTLDPDACNVHPDIPFKAMNESAKTAAHTTAQGIAAAIGAREGGEDNG